MSRIVLSLLILLFLLPFGYLLALSFAVEWRFPDLLPGSWTLAHWTQVSATGGSWAASALRSLLLATSVGLLSTGLGFLTAWHLSGHPRRPLWIQLAYLPYAFSPVIYAHCLKFFFHVSNLWLRNISPNSNYH